MAGLMANADNNLNSLLDKFQKLTKDPVQYLECHEDLGSSVKDALKQSYDFCKSQEIIVKSSSALTQLLVRNFDTEQIWQQIELQNEGLLNSSLKSISKLLVNKDKLVFTNIENKLNLQNDSNISEENSDYGENDNNQPKETDDEISNSEDDDNIDLRDVDDGENRKRRRGSVDETDNDEDVNLSDADGDENVDEPVKAPNSKASNKKSIVDDEFFKLDEMEKFLQDEEKKMNDPDSGNDSEESEEASDDDGDIDYFKDDLEEEENNVRTAKFKDFFVAKDDGKATKRNKFLQEMSEEEEETYQKSTFELRQERLQKKIDKLEQKAIGDKPWTLKGEIKADDRPQNSLLEEVLEFDMTARPAPVITEKTTLQLEDIILQRIKDKVFDSVERKAKPVETPLEYKKKLVLDQEKSKHSLAQIYEKEFLDQQAALDPENAEKEEEEPELHKEVKKMMQGLFRQLDALSNFHFTPRPAVPELKVINNLPAVNMEEVAPVTASEAALLAPEEIRNKARTDILGQTEKTATDKKRERRKKKQKQKHHVKQINKNLVGSGRGNPKQNKLHLTEVMKSRNVEKMDEKLNSKSLKSSKAFFQQLQEQAQAHIGERKQAKKKKVKLQQDARKLKL